MKRQMQRSYGWRDGRGCQRNYKKMDGSPDGFKGKVKMDPSLTWVVIGKHENRENGKYAQIYLVNLMKTLLIPSKGPNFNLRMECKKPCIISLLVHIGGSILLLILMTVNRKGHRNKESI